MGSGPKCAECQLEKLGKGFTRVEVGARYESTRLLLVGESSGENEVRDSLPFRPYAQSGSLLQKAMSETNISRSEVAITNIVRCKPPGDILEGAWYGYGATQSCITNYLVDMIAELKPRVILALGGVAFRALVAAPKGRQGTLDYIRGYAMPGAGAATGVTVIPTYHPAFLRRGASHLTPLLQRDLRRAFLIATGKLKEGEHYALDPKSLDLNYQIAPSILEAKEYADSLTESTLAFDIETPMSGRSDEDNRNSFTERDVKMIQFSQRRGSGIALPWRDEYIDVAKAILAKPMDKVGFNCWNFDVPVLKNNGVIVAGSIHDAMVMFHVYHPDLPANLQTVAGFCGFRYPWKHLNESDPEFYGVTDADATLHSFEVMKGLLEREIVCAT